ncbi:hypothetical protein C5167_024722 [Papaver somniferum]|uniref:Uncharacterized protein n=1 Tax=Papaver somniferum TaxID=3469 RepID=A0A4Y7JSC5_PAPSO|nr:hypothetical protein C5167_024722 [Papaver somniferum]
MSSSTESYFCTNHAMLARNNKLGTQL